MLEEKIFLTGLDTIREYVSPWVAFVISVLALLAFWPKLKASAIGKLTIENARLRSVIADMIVEESIKNVIIANNKKRIEELETELIEQHRINFDHVHSSKNPEGAGR